MTLKIGSKKIKLFKNRNFVPDSEELLEFLKSLKTGNGKQFPFFEAERSTEIREINP